MQELEQQNDHKEFSIELGALKEVPIWENHKRGKNWLAVIHRDPLAPAGLARKFARRANGEFYYMVTDLQKNDAIEFGADYYTGAGRKVSDRFYGIVVDVQEDKLILQKHKTAIQAIKAQKK